jgi:two-component system response regulator DctR
MSRWTVLIVEDDREVARIHHQLVSDMRGFHVVGVAGTGAQALQMVANTKPDLLLLDLGLPRGDGLSLLRRLRAERSTVEVIAVTAACETPTIRATLHLGVVDYLVKPFEPERLRQALGQFAQRMSTFNRPSLQQDSVDVLRMTAAPRLRWVPKDLRPERVRLVREVLADAEHPLSADEVGAITNTARVTARRYLEYLVAIGQARAWSVSDGPGRPRKVYELDWAGPVGAARRASA